MENEEWRTRYETAIYTYKKIIDELIRTANDACELMELKELYYHPSYKKLKKIVNSYNMDIQ